MMILHIVPSYVPALRYGGPIRSVHGLCKALANRGNSVHVFTTNVDGPYDSDVPLGQPVELDGVKVWYYPSKYFRRLFWSWKMRQALEKRVRDFDILHLHSIYLWPTAAAASIARSKGIPYVVSPRGMLVKDLVRSKSRIVKTCWISLIEKRNIEKAAAVHVTSCREEAEARRFSIKYPPILPIPNGVDLDVNGETGNASVEINELLDRKNLILYLGRVNWEKGLDRLIPAMRHIPSAHLVIAGNDEENYRPALERLAADHGVSDRITFTGPVQDTDKAALLKHADILVLPSYSENFGNVILEAMAVGCPVAVTPEVGAADIVRNCGSGLILDGQPDILGTGLRDMLDNQAELTKMGRRGRKAVEENFTWDAAARQMEIVYQQVLDNLKTAQADRV